MKQVYVAVARTESLDRYVYVFNYEPSQKEVILLVMRDEGARKNQYKNYSDQTAVEIANYAIINKV